MSVFKGLNVSNSTIITWGGVELRTTQDPYVSDDGTYYEAHAVDKHDNEYTIQWEVIDFETTDESEACDWNNPIAVLPLSSINLSLSNLSEVLKGQFKFRQWSKHKVSPKEFENDLSEFGTFNVYGNFRSWLEDNNIYLEDENGDLMDIEQLLANEESYNDFIEEKVNMDNFNALRFEDLDKKILCGEGNTSETFIHFALVDNINTHDDLLSFINDVLKDLGEVTHSSGLKNEYEVVLFIR